MVEPETAEGLENEPKAERPKKLPDKDSDPRKLLTTEQLQLFKDFFSELDPQGKGKVPTKQIGTALRMMGLNPRQKEIRELMQKVDPEAQGAIDFQTFLLALAERINEVPETPAKVIEAFRVLDVEKSGSISASQLTEYLTTMGEYLEDFEIDALVKTADINGTGTIDYEEFVLRMTEVPQEQEKSEGKNKKKK